MTNMNQHLSTLPASRTDAARAFAAAQDAYYAAASAGDWAAANRAAAAVDKARERYYSF